MLRVLLEIVIEMHLMNILGRCDLRHFELELLNVLLGVSGFTLVIRVGILHLGWEFSELSLRTSS